jgi:hypothetical protein
MNEWNDEKDYEKADEINLSFARLLYILSARLISRHLFAFLDYLDFLNVAAAWQWS